jgi:hypothetical protein
MKGRRRRRSSHTKVLIHSFHRKWVWKRMKRLNTRIALYCLKRRAIALNWGRVSSFVLLSWHLTDLIQEDTLHSLQPKSPLFSILCVWDTHTILWKEDPKQRKREWKEKLLFVVTESCDKIPQHNSETQLKFLSWTVRSNQETREDTRLTRKLTTIKMTTSTRESSLTSLLDTSSKRGDTFCLLRFLVQRHHWSSPSLNIRQLLFIHHHERLKWNHR